MPASLESEQDIIVVANIDTNCDDVDTDEHYSHRDYFQVRWDGVPHQIKPGQTKLMARFLGKHFAIHLANHILLNREKAENKVNLVQSAFDRPATIDKILLSVESAYGDVAPLSEGERVARETEKLNEDPTKVQPAKEEEVERAIDLGEVEDPLYGKLKGPKDKPTTTKAKAEPAETTTSIYNKEKPLPSHEELVRDAETLEIELKGDETDEQIIGLLKAF